MTWNHDEDSAISIVPARKQTIVEMRNGSSTPTTMLAPKREIKHMNSTCCHGFETIRLNDLKSTKSKDMLVGQQLLKTRLIKKNYNLTRVFFVQVFE